MKQPKPVKNRGKSMMDLQNIYTGDPKNSPGVAKAKADKSKTDSALAKVKATKAKTDSAMFAKVKANKAKK